MELRHLRYFVAVAEELNFSRAAERLHVGQPGVSQQVRKLEEELGVRLFERTPRSVALTDAGAALLDEAPRVLRHADIAQMAARDARGRGTFRLRMGHVPDSLPACVSRAMQLVGTTAPRAQISLETGPALRLIEEVRAGQLDTAVVGLPAPVSGLRVTSAGRQRIVAAVPATDPHAFEPKVSLGRLAPERIVVLPAGANPAFESAIAAICRDAGVSPTPVAVGEPRVEHTLLAVACGVGPALLPESVAERYVARGVRFVPLEDAGVMFDSVVLTRPEKKDLSTIAFLRALDRSTRAAVVDVPPRIAHNGRRNGQHAVPLVLRDA
jgi:DNA-binding transcriptional LysR family regulator